jgi:hypothetical protein
MYLYVWRHNRKFHSWSMFTEPCVHQSLYTDAVIIAVAESPEQALDLLAAKEEGWIIDELRRLQPQIFKLKDPSVLFSDIRHE